MTRYNGHPSGNPSGHGESRPLVPDENGLTALQASRPNRDALPPPKYTDALGQESGVPEGEEKRCFGTVISNSQVESCDGDVNMVESQHPAASHEINAADINQPSDSLRWLQIKFMNS